VTSDANGNLAMTPLSGFATSADIANINARLDDLTARSDKAFTGVAMAFAMASMPQLQPNERVAVASSLGTFAGQYGGALTTAVRLFDHVQFNAGLGIGLSNKIAGGQVGLRIGW
jgi:peptidoglycan hydrolase-like protein with peptidoglycan-binding domain